MNPSLGCFKSKASQRILPCDPSEDILFSELLPKGVVHLASSLSRDEKVVLAYLVVFGQNAVFWSEVPASEIEPPSEPWRTPLFKGGTGQKYIMCCSSFNSVSSTVLPSGRVVAEMRSSSSSKERGFCDCFSCYAGYWNRWNISQNRDIINEILEILEENSHEGTEGKELEIEEREGVLECSSWAGGDKSVKRATRSGALLANDMYFSVDGNSISAVEALLDAPSCRITAGVPESTSARNSKKRKKRIFRSMKQKLEYAKGEDDETREEVRGGLKDSDKGGNLTPEVCTATFMDDPLSASDLKASPKLPQHQRLAKHRTNQVLPLNYEDDGALVSGMPEAPITGDEGPFSPRSADVGLGARGLLGRVFPDTLGRVASRLWDLVSLRSRSHAVEYH
ncbi:hypothetical protein KP509_22G074400 [Ceratopteris richardii]|nr:hypothetical protein KP509_22G074400 [Ceratopteris richardii]